MSVDEVELNREIHKQLNVIPYYFDNNYMILSSLILVVAIEPL